MASKHVASISPLKYWGWRAAANTHWMPFCAAQLSTCCALTALRPVPLAKGTEHLVCKSVSYLVGVVWEQAEGPALWTGRMGKARGLRVRQTAFTSQLSHSQADLGWAGAFTTLRLCFCICQMDANDINGLEAFSQRWLKGYTACSASVSSPPVCPCLPTSPEPHYLLPVGLTPACGHFRA